MNRAKPHFIGILVMLAALGGVLTFCAGCSENLYTERLRSLDNAYQNGYMPREDYMRFSHDAELWEKKWLPAP